MKKIKFKCFGEKLKSESVRCQYRFTSCTSRKQCDKVLIKLQNAALVNYFHKHPSIHPSILLIAYPI